LLVPSSCILYALPQVLWAAVLFCISYQMLVLFWACSCQMFWCLGEIFNHYVVKTSKRQSSYQQLLWEQKNVGHVPECYPFMYSGVDRYTLYYDVLFVFYGCLKWHKVAGWWLYEYFPYFSCVMFFTSITWDVRVVLNSMRIY
jgi:hypothetical protein